MNGRDPRRQLGFTLLEMLVAVAILAALAAVIPRSFVSARAALDGSKDWLEARLVADAVLSQELAGPALRPGVLSGDVDGRRWRAVLEPSRSLARAEGSDRALLDVRLAVSVSGDAMLRVETLRIGFAQ